MPNFTMSMHDHKVLQEQTKKFVADTQKYFTADEIEAANEVAIELIIAAGFDERDSDQLGDECGDALQAILALAALRCPELGEIVGG